MTAQVFKLNLVSRATRTVTVDNDGSLSADDIISALWEREGGKAFSATPMTPESSETSFFFDEPLPGTYDGLWPNADSYYKVQGGSLHFHTESKKLDMQLPSDRGLQVRSYKSSSTMTTVVHDLERGCFCSIAKTGNRSKFAWAEDGQESTPADSYRVSTACNLPDRTFGDWSNDIAWNASIHKMVDLTRYSALAYCVWFSGRHHKMFWDLLDWFAYPPENPREFSLHSLLGGSIFDPTVGEYRDRLPSEFISLTPVQIEKCKALLSSGCQIATKNAVDRLLSQPTSYSGILSDWWTKRILFQGELVDYTAGQSMPDELKRIRAEIRQKC